MNVLQLLQTFSQSVPDFLAASVVSRIDGTSIGSLSARHELNPAAVDAYLSDMLNRNETAMRALGMTGSTEDILTTTDQGYIITRVLPGTQYFWNVCTGSEGSLGLTRAFMRKFEGDLLKLLP